MSRSSHYGVVACAAESSWAANTSTWGVRLPHVGAVDVSGLVRPKMDANRLVQYRNDGTMPIQGTFGGTFSLSLYLTGHGSTTAGATTVGEVETVLGHVFGTSASTGTGTTFTGGTATGPTTTSASGFSAGGIVFAGVYNDARGGGQPVAFSDHSGSALTLLTAMPAAPNNGDVCYSSVMMYTQETAAASVQSYRFLVQTGNLQYRLFGCVPTGVEITGLGPGEIPMATITYAVSVWAHAAETFPSTDTMDDFMPVANQAGSLFFNARGTATRATLAYRSFTINYQLGMQLVRGPGGVWVGQDIVGAVRTKDTCTISVVVDAETATASPTHPGNWDSESQFYHLLLGLNASATGQRVAMYWPRICYDGNRPVQTAQDNINRMQLNFRAYTNTTNTTDLTSSMFRMAWG